MDGGNGGNGGHGGNGGNGGLGGNGGNGSHGGKVVIHTNDPSVLALLEVDVSSGEGGAPGTHGKPGQGGNPGQGGPGGPGGTYIERRGEATFTRQSKPGHKGKQGKKGKNGRPAPTKQSKSGTSGSHGSVSFCIYDETGMSESGGTPFRVLFNKKDLLKLYPLPINFGVLSQTPEDVVIYGQKLQFGPVLPINVGSLSAPQSELLCFLVMHGRNIVSTVAIAPFPRIPAENKTRYGELPPNAAQTAVLTVPKLKDTGFVLDGDLWPLPSEWSPTTQCLAKFRTLLKVDGIMQKYSSSDGDNVSSKEFDVVCDIPVQIVLDQSGTGLLAPRSVLIGKNVSFHVQFAVRNRLAHAPLDPQFCGIGVIVAGHSFLPKVRRPESSEELATTEFSTPTPNGYSRLRVRCPSPAVLPGQVQPLSFLVTLPESGPEPGRSVFIRAELAFEGDLVQHTPARSVRLCVPWPPESPPSASDLLVFVDETFAAEDFGLIRSIAVTMGFNACFLDYQHFAEMNSGSLPASVWAPHKGKATILWLPSLSGITKLVPVLDLVDHVRSGGAFIFGGQCGFTLPQDLTKLSAHVFRRVINLGPSMTMQEIKKGLQLDEKSISGQGLIALVLALFMSLTIEQKLLNILQKGESLGRLVVGDIHAGDYQTTVAQGGGCCSGGGATQVVPVRKSLFTIRDAWVCAVRTDLSLDRRVFLAEQNLKHCIAVEALQAFANKNILGARVRTRDVALAARDLCAAVYAADMLNEAIFAGGSRVVWSGLAAQLKLLTMRCESFAMEHKLDVKAMAERAKDVDIIAEVKGRVSGGTVVNLGPCNISYLLQI